MSSQRPQTGRRSSNAPYSRPNSSNSNKWTHDLFGPKSSANSPALGQVSSPFGSTPPTPTTPTNGHPQQNARFGAAANSNSNQLLGRFGIKGGSKAQADGAAQREQQRLAVQERQRQQRQQEEDRKARQLAEQHRAQQLAVAEAEQFGFVVQVEGLVFGTSAEDVQTAFGQYGATLFCLIVNEAELNETDELVARLTFERHADAVEACAKLNGAIADGRPLVVKQVERTPIPAPLPPILSGVRGAAPPTGPRVQRNAAPPPISNKMASDALPVSEMQLDGAPHQNAPPTAPKAMMALGGAGRGAKTGGGARGGAHAGAGVRAKSAPSLGARLGIPPPKGQPQAQGQGKGKKVDNSLLARMGAAPANGAGGVAKGGKGGNSLLARLK